jgi:hypothetical protein
MTFLFRAYRAGRWFQRRHRPMILQLSRAMIPVLIAFTGILFRVSALAAATVATLNIVFLAWMLYLQLKRQRALRSWRPWVP